MEEKVKSLKDFTYEDFLIKIGSLYSEFVQCSYKTNVEDAARSKRIEISKFFYLFFKKFSYRLLSSYQLSNNKEIGIVMKTSSYDLEICQSIKNCLKSFHNDEITNLISKNDELKIGRAFSSYVIQSVKRAINNELNNDTSDSSNLHIPENKIDKIKKLRKLDEDYLKYGITDVNARNRKIAVCLEVDVDYVINLRELDSQYCNSMEQKNELGDDFSLADSCRNSVSETYSPEKSLIEKDSFSLILNIIQQEWMNKKKAKDVLSDLLTCDILGLFQGTSSNNKLSDFFSTNINVNRECIFSFDFDLGQILGQYDFINKDFLNNFLNNNDYKIPTQEQLSEKHNFKTKGGINHKIKRFYEELGKNPKLKEFKDNC